MENCCIVLSLPLLSLSSLSLFLSSTSLSLSLSLSLLWFMLHRRFSLSLSIMVYCCVGATINLSLLSSLSSPLSLVLALALSHIYGSLLHYFCQRHRSLSLTETWGGSGSTRLGLQGVNCGGMGRFRSRHGFWLNNNIIIRPGQMYCSKAFPGLFRLHQGHPASNKA